MKRGFVKVQYDKKIMLETFCAFYRKSLNGICMSLGIIKVNNLILLMNNKCVAR